MSARSWLGAALRELFAVDYPPEREVRRLLRDTYDETGIEIWLRSPNRHLSGLSPMQAIDAGQADRVLAEARRVAGDGNG